MYRSDLPAPSSRLSLEQLHALVAQTLRDLHPGRPDLPPISSASTLDRELGFDSLGRMELLLRIESAAAVALPEETLQNAETVDDLWQALQQGRARAPTGASAPPQTQPAQPVSAAPLPAGGSNAAPWLQAHTLLDVLDAHVQVHPDLTQIIYLADNEQTRISYRQLADASAAVAAGLQRAGLKQRQTVAIMLPTSPAYFYTYLGILRAGGIPVPIYPPARPSQLEDHVRRHTGILESAQTVLMVSVPQAMTVARLLQARVPGLRALLSADDLLAQAGTPQPVPVRSDDTAFIQYTSGSTGQPKGVALTHANLLANIRAMLQVIDARSDDVFVSWLPLYHDMGLIGAWLNSFYVGCPLVVMSPLAFLARPQRWLETISSFGGTLSAGPNFAYELCLSRIGDEALAGLDLSRWRLAFNGAEPVLASTLSRFQQRFAACGFRPEAMTPVYGLAESSVGLLFPPLGRGPRVDVIERATFEREQRAVPSAATDGGALRFVACGRALPGHEVRIVDAAGQTLPERTEGRLVFRGPSATQGYWRAPEQSARLFQNGWLDSGDRAYAAEDDIFVTGRVKDIVIRAGRNLYPQEIEDAVGAVPGVRKGCVAVFGRSDADSGTERLVVLAEIQPRHARAPAELRAAVARAVVDAIGEPADEIILAPPHTVLKTSSGKVRRAACRVLVEQGGVGASTLSPQRQWLRLALGSVGLRARAAAHRLVQRSAGLLFGLWALLLFALFTPLVWLLVQTRPNQASAWALCRFAARGLLRLSGLPLSVQGLQHLPTQTAAVLVCNHASYLDGLVLVAALPKPHAFVVKRELASQFVAGRFLRRLGVAFVERFDPRRSVADAQAMAAAAQAGQSLLLFPEGTFRASAGLLPFRLGGFIAAAQAEVPLLPVTLTGTRTLLPGERWWPRWTPLSVQIGAPLEPVAGADLFASAVQLRDAARAVIVSGLPPEEA
ncbi:AMP-binding protein [Hydrogenophaga sp.]|uniref:AMP-binding protein n=1 Tax=Hydrogenophaga sp. TaxID=1904254 RepID=UPI0025C5D394|nr:AMP-binding protein [Hydrogenophaga sp.]